MPLQSYVCEIRNGSAFLRAASIKQTAAARRAGTGKKEMSSKPRTIKFKTQSSSAHGQDTTGRLDFRSPEEMTSADIRWC